MKGMAKIRLFTPALILPRLKDILWKNEKNEKNFFCFTLMNRAWNWRMSAAFSCSKNVIIVDQIIMNPTNQLFRKNQ